MLFDSGSDGDIAFIRKSEQASTDMHKQLHPQYWKTSSGIFETNKLVTHYLVTPVLAPQK